MNEEIEYNNVISFCKKVDEKAEAQLDSLMNKWMKCLGNNEHYACAISLLHNKLGNSIHSISFLEKFLEKFNSPAPIAKRLLSELYFKQGMIGKASELYADLLNNNYNDGFLVNKYLWCLQNKVRISQKTDIREENRKKLITFINKVLKSQVFDMCPADLHQNLHIGTKTIRDVQKEAISRGIPPIIIMTSGHTASTTIINSLSQVLGTGAVGLQGLVGKYLVDSAVEIFSKGGLISRIQCAMNQGNVKDVLLKYGLTKIAFVVRDPRECMLSNQRMQIQRQCGYDDESLRITQRNVSTNSTYIQKQLNKFNALYTTIYFAWKEFISERKDFNINFFSFNNFKKDKITFLKKIVIFYSIPDESLALKYDQIIENQSIDHNYRANVKNRWQDYISNDLANELESIMPQELIEYFGWPKRYYY